MKSLAPLMVCLIAVLTACSQGVEMRETPKAPESTQAPESAQVPEGHPPMPPMAGHSASLSMTAPEGWVVEKPSSSMRAAQYALPGEGEASDAEVVVFFFGPGQGGGVEANLERWKGQFTRPDGTPAAPDASLESRIVNELPVTLLDISGTYDSGMMMGGGGPRTGQRMRAAVIETRGGNYFVRLLGPAATVERWSDSFDSFLGSAAF
jgi:hypothetical protein